MLFKKKTTETNQPDQTAEVGSANIAPAKAKSRFISKKVAIAAVCVMLLVAVILSVFWQNNRNKPTKTVTSSEVCMNDTLYQAAPLLYPTKHEQLKPLVEKIKATKDYERDPNCLNIVVTYYINISDYANAKSNLDKLEKVYTNKGFSPQLGGNVLNIEQLRERVDSLKKIEDEFKQHGRLAPPEQKP